MDPLSLSLIIIFFGFCLELLGGISNLSSSLNLFFVGVRSDGGGYLPGGHRLGGSEWRWRFCVLRRLHLGHCMWLWYGLLQCVYYFCLAAFTHAVLGTLASHLSLAVLTAHWGTLYLSLLLLLWLPIEFIFWTTLA